jgi:uncharacterized protein (DUF1499 family)
MTVVKQLLIGWMSVIAIGCLNACGAKRPDHLGGVETTLMPCPKSPNCVTSAADKHSDQYLAPWTLMEVSPSVWDRVVHEVLVLPRTRVITQTDDYLYVECRSQVFGFVDDLELYLQSSVGQIMFRSAARLGYSDFSVNRQRLEKLRFSLASRGLLR